MADWQPALAVAVLVAAILAASKQPLLAALFRWAPIPLWCYLLPALAKTSGVIATDNAAYGRLGSLLLPVALPLLLLQADLAAFLKTGRQALIAAAAGAVGVMAGAILGALLLGGLLPEDAWKAVGGLSATWTGGTLNLLSVRSVLDIPSTLFAPLVVTDAVVAYSWMALLMALAGSQARINRWLGVAAENPAVKKAQTADTFPSYAGMLGAFLLAAGLSASARVVATALPASALVSSANGWTVLLVTTAALLLSLIPPVRRMAASSSLLGQPLLYAVLAATGAQADLGAFASSPRWLLLGGITVTVHGALLLACGRWLRIPLGTLATASQANIGGMVSAPMVGAVFHNSLAAVGLLLAMAGNALGTYCGLLAAAAVRLAIKQ